ncbi:MAG: hypothetical protein ACLQFR_06155 [Streptosporangiaceae bacterium]
MEPAVEQREHAGVVALRADLDLAAMEPAVEQREHGRRGDLDDVTGLAAWSPP